MKFTVNDLPYRRTVDELQLSPFVQCLDAGQKIDLIRWTREALVGSQFSASWVSSDEGQPQIIMVQRVE